MRKYKLGDIATVEISGVDKKIKDGEEDIRLCNFVDVYYNWAITMARHDSFMLATARPNEISKFQLKKGQVALTKDSETRDDIGISTYIADDFNDVILGYHCALITPNKDILDGRYLNALMHTGYAKKYFACNASGSGQRYALSAEILNSFPVPVIPLQKQKQIGEIFSALDKKIELNKQINQNLEAMAKQLYDYWFVQFDFPNEEGKPYKSSGGKMIWNEKLKREIPNGWNNCTLQEFLTIKNGRDHKHLATGSHPVYGSGGEMRRVNEYLFSGESVLMPRKGTLNNIMYVNESFWTVDTMFYSEMKIVHSAKYVFFAIKDIDFTKWNSGTGLPSMTASTLYNISMIKPSDDLLKRFNDVLIPVFYKIKQTKDECEKLIRQRDELLPLLMNGQVSVNSDLSVCINLIIRTTTRICSYSNDLFWSYLRIVFL
ncbi:restriction endonuclease subunit S [Alistipes putredinis]|uniref:restriction endonuclease subunit S n=2 Tax=Alistipes TaxID=239759 RepID=UPI002431D1E5|nr:restriction endonuclease subunit S [Alistipes putredinis]